LYFSTNKTKVLYKQVILST